MHDETDIFGNPISPNLYDPTRTLDFMSKSPKNFFPQFANFGQSYGQGTDAPVVGQGLQANGLPINEMPKTDFSSGGFNFGDQTSGNPYTASYEDSFWGQQVQRDQNGVPIVNNAGELQFQNGMTNFNMLQTGMGALQMGLGFSQNRKKLDIARGTLNLGRDKFDYAKGQAQKLDDAYASLAARDRGERNA